MATPTMRATDPYAPTRPIMGRDELQEHHVSTHGRNFILSDDGSDDVELAEKTGWRAVYGWGQDGWDLGDVPYVTIQLREHEDQFLMQQIVEGDHDIYTFDTEADREAAVDYLFLWYAAERDWSPLTWETRDVLDGAALIVPPQFRGPFSWARADAP